MKNNARTKDHVGEVHGIYTIVEKLNEKDTSGHTIYRCICNVCGHVKKCSYGHVASPSCITNKCKHSSINWIDSRISSIFWCMVARCYNPDSKDYKWYGEKGVQICDEWLHDPKLFEEWALHNGYQGDLTIDRIDANKNYCPENCRWMTREENSRRGGKVNWITANGETLTGKQWSSKLCIGVNAINNAVRNFGLNKTVLLIEKMLKEPPSTKTRKSNETWFSVYGIPV